MPTWLTVVIVVLGIYTIGMLGMFAYSKNIFLSVLWPFTLIWMLFGNIQ